MVLRGTENLKAIPAPNQAEPRRDTELGVRRQLLSSADEVSTARLSISPSPSLDFWLAQSSVYSHRSGYCFFCIGDNLNQLSRARLSSLHLGDFLAHGTVLRMADLKCRRLVLLI